MDEVILRLTLRSTRAHLLRFLLTTFAVFIGVTFITTAYGLADQLRGILDDQTSGCRRRVPIPA
jgi:putative ABC transport system permease protein